MIAAYDVSTPASALMRIHPDVVSRNSVRYFKLQSFVVSSARTRIAVSKLETQLHFSAGFDRDGTYDVIREVKRPLIDSAILQVCTRFADTAIRPLYRDNTFMFRLKTFRESNTAIGAYPKSLIYLSSLGKSVLDHRKPEKPRCLLRRQFSAAAQKMIDDVIFQIRGGRIENTIPGKILSDIPGWAWFDQFLRFIITISPKNAAMIRDITFIGTVKRVGPSVIYLNEACNEDFPQLLLLYIPFLRAFFPNLRKLTLELEQDVGPHTTSFLATVANQRGSASHVEQRLRPILEGPLRTLESLVELVVVDGAGVTPDFAKESIAFFPAREVEEKKYRPEAKSMLPGDVASMHEADDAVPGAISSIFG